MPEDEVDQAIESGRLFNSVGVYSLYFHTFHFQNVIVILKVMMGEREKRMLFQEVKSRHDDIIMLEKSIRELAEMFQDVSMLVYSHVRLSRFYNNSDIIKCSILG